MNLNGRNIARSLGAMPPRAAHFCLRVERFLRDQGFAAEGTGVLLAFSGEPGEVYEQIRKRGFHWSIGEREQGVSTVSAPVFGRNWRLLGSLCISGPASRLPASRLDELAPKVISAANKLSYLLSANTNATPQAPSGFWHPH